MTTYEFTTKDFQTWSLTLLLGPDRNYVWHLQYQGGGGLLPITNVARPAHLYRTITDVQIANEYPHVLEWCRDALIEAILEPQSLLFMYTWPIAEQEKVQDGLVECLQNVQSILSANALYKKVISFIYCSV